LRWLRNRLRVFKVAGRAAGAPEGGFEEPKMGPEEADGGLQGGREVGQALWDAFLATWVGPADRERGREGVLWRIGGFGGRSCRRQGVGVKVWSGALRKPRRVLARRRRVRGGR
jgi:hypothetical protein